MNGDVYAKVVSVEGEKLPWTIKEKSKNIFRLDLEVPYQFTSKAKPGMFCAFKPASGEHVQRRPFSIVEARKDVVSFIVKDVGPNTHYYTHLSRGSIINITQPRGKEIEIDEKKKNYILVAGGIGAAALVYIARKLRLLNKNVTVLLGGKNYKEIVGYNYFWDLGCDVKTIVEEEAFATGLVTDLLKSELFSGIREEVISCGPIQMMNAVHDLC
ncbi:hypothetical protein DRH27_02460, partial [Candidatus Falkowbacteria bacterium]